MYLSWPVLDNLRSLSYLSTRYTKIARVSLDLDRSAASGDDRSRHLPNDEIVVMMVDNGGDATIGIDLQEFRSLLLLLLEIEVDRFVR